MHSKGCASQSVCGGKLDCCIAKPYTRLTCIRFLLSLGGLCYVEYAMANSDCCCSKYNLQHLCKINTDKYQFICYAFCYLPSSYDLFNNYVLCYQRKEKSFAGITKNELDDLCSRNCNRRPGVWVSMCISCWMENEHSKFICQYNSGLCFVNRWISLIQGSA